MNEYTIQSQYARLYIRLTPSNIHVYRYRAEDIGPGMEKLSCVGRWQLHPTLSTNPKMTKMELVRAIQSATGDVYNDVIGEILSHKTTQPQGDLLSKKISTPNTDGSSSPSLKAISPSLYQRLKKLLH